MTVEKDIQRFKMDLLRHMPFYGDIVMRLPIVADSSIPTACTNGATIRYNPGFFQSLETGERNFVLLHEVFHVLLLHCRRSEGRDPRMWNTACDLVVNQMLTTLRHTMRAEGIPFQRPEKGLYAQIPRDITTEAIYEKIAADNRKLKKNSKKILLKKNYVWGPQDLPSNIQEVEIPDDLDDYVVLEATGVGMGKGGTSESGAGGKGMTEAEARSLQEQLVRSLIRESVTKNRSDMGSYYIPNQMLSLVESKRLNWKTLLRDFLSEEVSDEVSYTTPERKYLHMDLILPGHSMSEEHLEEVWAFVDSSGSISQDELNQFLTQLHRIAKEFQCIFNICYWDTRVTDVYRKVRGEGEILNCLPKHSGGTNINCVYDWIQANKVKPDVMLILTDGAFGRLTTPAFQPKYRKKTILVLSSQLPASEDMKRIGKIATL